MRAAAALAALLLSTLAASAADCSIGYTQGPGGYYRADDRSGPYFINSACVATPVSGAVSSSGVPQTDTVVQGVAAYRGFDIAANISTQVMALNAARRGFVIQNQTTGACYYKIGGAAATLDRMSFRLGSGATYETPPQHTSTGAVNMICAAAGGIYATEF